MAKPFQLAWHFGFGSANLGMLERCRGLLHFKSARPIGWESDDLRHLHHFSHHQPFLDLINQWSILEQPIFVVQFVFSTLQFIFEVQAFVIPFGRHLMEQLVESFGIRSLTRFRWCIRMLDFIIWHHFRWWHLLLIIVMLRNLSWHFFLFLCFWCNVVFWFEVGLFIFIFRHWLVIKENFCILFINVW